MPPGLNPKYFSIASEGWKPGPYTEPSIGIRKREDMTFLVGVVDEVDEDRYVMTVNFYGGIGKINNIPITHPFASAAGYVAGMPQKGTIVIVGNQYDFRYPLAYIPNYVHALDAKNVRIYPEDLVVPTESNELFFKFPKLKKGEVALGSAQGVEVFLGNRYVLNHMTDEFVMDGNLDMTSTTSLNNWLFAGGVWRNAGVVTRNYLKKSNTKDGHFANVEMLEEGASRCRLKLAPEDTRMFSEYLIEVEDMTIEDAPRNEINSVRGDYDRQPVAVFAMGNFVGNNPNSDNYAKMLRAGLFSAPEDHEGQLTLEPLTGEDAENYGMSLVLFCPNRRNPESGSFIGIDKEGHYYQYVPAATGGGLGQGRSISIVAKGSKKEILGAEEKYGTSWDLYMDGGMRWVVGTHGEKDGSPYSNRSIDVRAKSSAFYMYGGTDDTVKDFNDSKKTLETSDLSKYRKIEKIDGKERQEVRGDREAIIGGSEKLQIAGMRSESIAGALSLNVGADMNVTVTSVLSHRAKQAQETFGSRVTTITEGDSELTIKPMKGVGNIKETIYGIGSRKLMVTTGNIEETIVTGKREVKITTGNNTFTIATGNHEMSTASGNISFSTKIGTFEAKSTVKSSLLADMTAGVVMVEGGSISLKTKEQLMGGVITEKTHRDYITGAPLAGSKTVKAAGVFG